MPNQYSGYGKIIRIVEKTAEELGTQGNLLELNVSCYTGEKKKEEDEYPPQIIFKLTMWGAYADSLSPLVEVGSRVCFSGNLGVPEIFEDKEGETRVNFKLNNVKVILIDKPELEQKPTYNKAGASKNTKATSSKPPERTKSLANKSSNAKRPAVTFEDDATVADSEEFDFDS